MGRGKATVDKVAVRVYPDTTGFAEEMRRWTDRRWHTDVKVFLDSTEATAMMNRIENTKRNVWMQAQVDAKDAQAHLKELSGAKTYIDLDVRIDEASEHLLDIHRRITELDKAGKNLELKLKGAKQVKDDLQEARDKAYEAGKAAGHAWDNLNLDKLTRAKAEWREIRNEVKRLTDERKEVELDFRKAKKELDHLTSDKQVKIDAEIEAEGARLHLMTLTRARVVNIIARLKTAEFTTELNKVMVGMMGLTMMENWARSMSRFFQNLPQHVLRIGMLTTAIGGLSSVAGSMLGSFAPIGRSIQDIAPAALFAIPAITGLAAGVGVLVMAFKDLSESSNVHAQAFHEVWQEFKDGLSDVQNRVRTAFFTPEFVTSFTQLSDHIIPELKSGMTMLASTMSITATNGMKAWRDALDDGAMSIFFTNLSFGFLHVDKGMSSFIVGLTNIATKGSEVFPLVGDWITRMGEKFEKWTTTADIARMMHDAAVQAGFLFDAVKNLGGIIGGLFHAMDTGKSTGLESFAKTLGKVRTIVNSDDFQTAMHTVFSGAAKGAEALRIALGPVGRDLEKLSPLLGKILDTLGGTAASVLKGIASALSTPVAQNGLYAALEGLSMLMKNMPWTVFGQALGSVGILLGQTAPLVGDLVHYLAPLLPLVLDTATAFIPPLTSVVTSILPPLVSMTKILLSVVEPLAPLIIAVGTAWLTWKTATTIAKIGTDITSIVNVTRDLMPLATGAGDKILALKLGFSELTKTLGGSGGATAAIGGLKTGVGGLNPVVLGLSAAVGAGMLVWNLYRQKVEENKQAIREYKDSLDAATGAITENTKETVLKNLHEKVSQEQLDRLGVSYGQLAAAILSGKDAVNDWRSATIDASGITQEMLEGNSSGARLWRDTLGKVSDTAGEMAGQISTAQQETRDFNQAMAEINGTTTVAVPPLHDAAAAMLGLADGTDAAKDSIFGLDDAMMGATKSTNDYFIKVQSLIDAQKNAGRGWTDGSIAARENENTLLDLIKTNQGLYESYVKQGLSVDEISAKMAENRGQYQRVADVIGGDVAGAMNLFDSQVTQATDAALANRKAVENLEEQLKSATGQQFLLAAQTFVATGKLEENKEGLYEAGRQANVTAEQVDNYIASLDRIAPEVLTTMHANTARAVSDIEYATRNRTMWVTLESRGWGADSQVGPAGNRWATGGSIWGPGTGTSDSILAWLSNGEFVVRAAVANKYRGLLEHLNAMGTLPMPGFASGGNVGVSSILDNQARSVQKLISGFAPRMSLAINTTAMPNQQVMVADPEVVELLTDVKNELTRQGRTGTGLTQHALTRSLVDLLAPGLDSQLGGMRRDRELGI